MQFETTRVLVDPIARVAVGNDGIVDLYALPAYDDIAHLYSRDGAWYVQYPTTGAPLLDLAAADAHLVSKENIQAILGELREHDRR